MRSITPRLRLAAGFTLIEIVITLVLLGILAVLSSSLFYDNVQTAVVVNRAQSTADQGRYVMERIARELREVKYNTASGTYAVTSTLTGSPNSIIFVRSVPDASNNLTDTYIALCYAGGTVSLTYGVQSCPTGTPTNVLTTQATGFTLTFVDGNNNMSSTTGVTITTATLRAIDINLQMKDTSPSPASGQVINQYMRVSLRNL